MKDKRDVFHVLQVAFGVATSVFLVAVYVRPVPPTHDGHVRELRTERTVYVVDVKYLPYDTKSKP